MDALRTRLVATILVELEHAAAAGAQTPREYAERIAERLLGSHPMLRSGRRLYDQLREHLLHRNRP